MKRLWSAFRGWVSERLSTPSGRLGAAVGALGGAVWYTDQHGDPPVYLTGLLATTFGVWLGALGQEKQKQARETADTANRAEAKADGAQVTADSADSKADALGRVAVEHHPDAADDLTPPLPPAVTKGGGA